MNVLSELQAWYAEQCDGEWEHRYGISIETCDNPGWWVKIDLVGTSLLNREFLRIAENVDARGFPQSLQWLHCQVEDGVWNGAGDQSKLSLILEHFLRWARAETERRDSPNC